VSLPQPQARPLRAARLVALAVVAALAPAWVPPAARAEPSTVALQPVGTGAYYVYDAQPGTTISGRIKVVNRGSRPASARLFGADATTGATTGATYLTVPGHGRDVGKWLRLAAPSARLAPHQSKIVPFTVTIPRDARGGDHLGGITADPGVRRGRAVKHGGSTFRIDVRTVTVIAVEVKLPNGGAPLADITGLHAGGMRGYQQLFVGLANPGNVLFKGDGSMVVRKERGRVVKRMKFPVDTFVPHTQVQDPILVRGRPLRAGSYLATVTVRYAGKRLTKSFRFKVGAKELAQIYGSPPAARSPLHSKRSLLLIVLAAGLLLTGIPAAWIIARRRALRRARAELAARERDLRELELWAPTHATPALTDAAEEPAGGGDEGTLS
jgi:hypothetical protein